MDTTFGTLGVPFPLVEVLTAQGKTSAFPIQVATLPDTLAGRDVLGRGRTGSGKTLAFGIPMVARLGTRLAGGPRRPNRPLGLVLAPTRELATQIAATIEPLAAAYGLSTTTIFGGVSQQKQVAALKSGVDIVVACPGRLEDLMKQKHVFLDAIEITVLDEADHMADLGFLPGVTRIMTATPGDGQRMLFSATLDNGVDKIANRFLSQPISHGVEDPGVPQGTMEHVVFAASDATAKKDLVVALASGTGRRIMFTRTKHVAKRWARDLTAAGIPAADLHGNLSQGQRDRNLAEFATGETRVLVATDIAARGVHVDDIELVVHIDPPAEHKAYLHRSGRTARAGKEGVVVTLVLPEQRKDLEVLMRKAGIQAAVQPVTATSPAVTELIGEVAAFVKPAPKAPTQPQRPSSKPRQSSGGRTGQQGQARAPRDGQPRGQRGAGQSTARPQRGGVAWSSEGGGSLQNGGQQQRSGGQPAGGGNGGGGRRRRPAGAGGRPAAAGGGRGR
ncbi:DEAD/DEAH box helicase [Pseudolysinimonas sp.]|jgi:superfamily II DNA/RNA helicase|uniref:DEAD/DEAH box helicase n=1 Tax=Pseudolysinimonas sp. TaxID=2680009 RepID=UPI0037841A69